MTTPGQAFPDLYETQLKDKIERIKQQFSEFSLPELKIYTSPKSHFRMRAEFKIWQQDNKISFVMFDKMAPKEPIEITNFSIGSLEICRLMKELLPAINSNHVLRQRLFQIEFLTTRSNHSIVTLIYHKKLDEEWLTAAEKLSQAINTQVIGRSKGQKIVVGNDFVIEEFTVADRRYLYQQVETGFTQPNAAVCEKMLNWAHSACGEKQENADLLELYCGNANFTLPLSTKFRKVLATEVSKTSVKSAKYNFELNKTDNIVIARMSSEEFTQALNGEREFNRLKDVNLKDYNFSTVFVDPPRSGLDKGTTELAKNFDRILYVSCNPNTLHANLEELNRTHHVEKFAVFDQFPYTEHLECGMLLTKKTNF